MKYIVAYLTILFGMYSSYAVAESPPVLRVLNWSEFIDTDAQVDESEPMSRRSPSLQAFARRFNCTVEYDEYTNESEMLNKIENMKSYYDVLITSLENVPPLVAAGFLAPVPDQAVPNLRHIPERYRNLLGDTPERYVVPYLVGTTGLIYRKDIVGRAVTSWKDYFSPPAALKGRIAALDTPLMLCMGLHSLRLDIHTRDAGEIKEAARLFYELRKNGFLRFISSNVPELRQGLLSGTLAMAVMYSGDALSTLAEAPDKLAYVLPEEGSEFTVDVLCLMRGAQSALALQFINFMLDPEIQAANAYNLHYAVPNSASVELLRSKHPEYFRDNLIFPTPETMQRLALYRDLHDAELRRWWRKILESAHPDVRS